MRSTPSGGVVGEVEDAVVVDVSDPRPSHLGGDENLEIDDDLGAERENQSRIDCTPAAQRG